MPRVPAYFDAFLRAIAEGARIDHVHLGHWDEPDRVGPFEARRSFAQAQACLSDRLVAMLEIGRGHRVLDVGSGFGGSLRSIRRVHPEAEAFGLNIDTRQLAVGLRIDATVTNATWIAADACRLPFGEDVFDRLLCVEAAFHFASRRVFFEEASRVLRPHGRLVLSDLLLNRPPMLPAETIVAFEDRLETDFGPWPTKWISLEEIACDAERAGFVLTAIDATANTWPSYHTIAPEGGADLTGGGVLRALHRQGCLRCIYIRLEKR